MPRFPYPVLAVAALAWAAPGLAQEALPAPEAPPAPPAPAPRVEVIVAPAPEAPRRLTFGFVLDPTRPPRVARVLPGSAVDRAGVRRGDVLVRIAGESATIDGIQRIARATAPGDTIEIVVRRDGGEEVVHVIPDEGVHVIVIDPDSIARKARHVVERAREGIAAWSADSFRFEIDSLVRLRFDSMPMGHFEWRMPDVEGHGRILVPPGFHDGEGTFEGGGPFSFAFGGPRLGLRVTEMNAGLADYFPGADEGVLVLDVEPGSPAAEAGVRAGDVIVAVNGREVWNLESFHAARDDGDTTLGIVRKGERREIRVEKDDWAG